MKIEGMTIIQGSKGSGKSGTAVSIALEHLRAGGVVAANFALKPGWAEKLARRHWRSMFDKKFQREFAISMYNRFFEVRNVHAILDIDVKNLACDRHVTRYYRNGEPIHQEGQGLLILDECSLVFNSRKSMQGDKNMSWIEFFTQARKHGWYEVLIAHKAEMIDSQIRDMAEYEVSFRNLQKVHIPFIGLPLSPFPAFLMISRYAGFGPGSGCIASKGLCLLPLWAARLYDSNLIFSQQHFNISGDPVHSGPPPALWADGGHIPSRSRQHCTSSLVGPHWDNYLMTGPAPE